MCGYTHTCMTLMLQSDMRLCLKKCLWYGVNLMWTMKESSIPFPNMIRVAWDMRHCSWVFWKAFGGVWIRKSHSLSRVSYTCSFSNEYIFMKILGMHDLEHTSKHIMHVIFYCLSLINYWWVWEIQFHIVCLILLLRPNQFSSLTVDWMTVRPHLKVPEPHSVVLNGEWEDVVHKWLALGVITGGTKHLKFNNNNNNNNNNK